MTSNLLKTWLIASGLIWIALQALLMWMQPGSEGCVPRSVWGVGSVVCNGPGADVMWSVQGSPLQPVLALGVGGVIAGLWWLAARKQQTTR